MGKRARAMRFALAPSVRAGDEFALKASSALRSDRSDDMVNTILSEIEDHLGCDDSCTMKPIGPRIWGRYIDRGIELFGDYLRRQANAHGH